MHEQNNLPKHFSLKSSVTNDSNYPIISEPHRKYSGRKISFYSNFTGSVLIHWNSKHLY